MKTEITANRDLWDELTRIHLKGSKIYPIKSFKKGKNVLNEIERKELGNVAGKTLLHLQCHFGMDTLSWARLGAKVTGVDFSGEAIKAAKNLSRETGIAARFITSDIFSLQGKLKSKFDVVFASYGALYWIPDIFKWMCVAASYLKKNGVLYMVDGHPFYNWLSRDEAERDLSKYRYSYFDRKTQKYTSGFDYADPSHRQTSPEYGWHFTVSDLINATTNAGLTIMHFNEFPSFKVKKYGSAWRPIGKNSICPIMFSLKARKP